MLMLLLSLFGHWNNLLNAIFLENLSPSRIYMLSQKLLHKSIKQKHQDT